MILNIRRIFGLIDSSSRKKIAVFGLIKIVLGIFDVIGILLTGALLAGLTTGEIVETSSLPFINQYSLTEVGLLAAASFLTKSIGSILFSKILIKTLTVANASISTEVYTTAVKNISWTTKNYSKSELNFLLSVAPGAAIEILLATITLSAESFLLLSILATFIIVDLEMSLLIMLYFGIIAITLNFFLGKKIKIYSTNESKSSIALTAIIYDTVSSFREIKSLKREKFFMENFRQTKFVASQSSGNISFINSLPKNILEPALMLGALGLILISITSGSASGSAQSIGIFLAGGLKIMSSLLPIQATFAAYNDLLAKVEILFGFLDYTIEFNLDMYELNSENNSELRPIGFTLSDLSFRYDEQASFVMSNINLKVEPGQLVALIGPSGSGKSTLADLIIGIEVPTTGDITFYNDLNKGISPVDFRIGYVAQNPGVISGTIRDNIALGLNPTEVDLNQLEMAINASNLRDLISELPNGYETDLGKQTDSVSGGQLQRIGLARALYIKPNLLILDEATSALDAETEAAVTETLSQLRGKATVVVIAHRLTTVQNADVVYVMNEGKIVANGKFSELTKSNPIVAKFVELSELNTD
jgi:ABC-type bacteriocin/lantibiotic exporter with double-glycine peptidase domain